MAVGVEIIFIGRIAEVLGCGCVRTFVFWTSETDGRGGGGLLLLWLVLEGEGGGGVGCCCEEEEERCEGVFEDGWHGDYFGLDLAILPSKVGR